MPSLQIYDTKGREYSPSGGTGRTNERVKELFYAGVRFAVESVGKTRVTAFFRARETRDARSEQFYAEYTTRDASSLIGDFNSALTRRVESEWGYTIDDSSDEMSVFRAIKQNAASVPGSDQDRRVLREMVGSGSIVNVGVRDATDAVGLIREMATDCSRAAITDSANTDSLSEFDLAIVTGGHSGIKPLGATEERWEQTEESLRKQFIDEEVGRIEDAVHALSRDHGLSSSEIRNRVTRRVPALKEPSTGSSGLAGAGGSSGDDGLVTAKMGKFAAIGAVALLLLIGVVFGAGMIGIGPFAGGGGESDASGTIEGVVYDGPVSEDPGGVEGADVTLLNETQATVNETTTDENGSFTFSGLEDGNYTIDVETEEHEYEQKSDVAPGEELEFTPIPTDAIVSGNVTDAETQDLIEDASVTLLGSDGDEIDSADGGEFAFDVDDADETYTIEANAEGYEESTVNATVGEPVTIELTESAALLSGTVQSESDDEPINDATITVESDGGATETTETDDDGSYEIELDRGEYDVEADADGYEPMNRTVTLDGDRAGEDFELTSLASYSGLVVDEETGDGINDADVTLSRNEEVVGTERSNFNEEPIGAFDFGELPEGSYEVVVERNGYNDYQDQFNLEPGENKEVTIELEPDS